MAAWCDDDSGPEAASSEVMVLALYLSLLWGAVGNT